MNYLFCKCQNNQYTPEDIVFLEDLMNVPPESISNKNKIRIVNTLFNNCDNEILSQTILRLISNISMEEEYIPILIENNVIRHIIKCLKLYEDNWIIQWLGASALWNLCRNNSARIQMRHNMTFLIKILRLHKDHKKVSHTIFGCLSNCALDDMNLVLLSEMKIFDIISEVINHLDDKDDSVNRSILSVCGALIANSSVSSDMDYKFLESDIIYRYIQKLKLIDIDFLLSSDLLKHALAAINNVSTCDGFKEEFTSASGYEFFHMIHSKLKGKEERSSDNDEAIDFIELIFSIYLPRWFSMDMKTTSLHICCYYNYHKLLLKLLYDEHANLYSIDGLGNTILHKAIQRHKFGIISFLCAIGFNTNIKNNNGESIFNLMMNLKNDEIRGLTVTAVDLGFEYYLDYKSQFNNFFTNNQIIYPKDLIEYLFKYVNIYKLQYLKIYS
jgi:hypothetical protein